MIVKRLAIASAEREIRKRGAFWKWGFFHERRVAPAALNCWGIDRRSRPLHSWRW